MSQHVSSLTIDALAAGHLAGDEASQARSHIDGCARCRGDFEAAEAACAKFTRDVLPRTVGKLRPRPWWRSVVPVLVPMVAAAVLLIWFVRKPDATSPGAGGPDDDIRIKGPSTFQVFAKRGDTVMPVRDGTKLAAGDAIRFVAGSRVAAHLLVASVDGAGKATLYFPYGGTRSGRIGEKPVDLPGSIVLDNAPGPERVFAVFTAEPIEADVVMRALTELGAKGGDAIRSTRTLSVSAKHQATILFEKDGR